MITPEKYETLPAEERRLWHSHVYEVKSGMLVMPNRLVPQAPWELAEKREMEKVVTLYGKTYHLWQTDRGDELPLGEPQLMTSYIADGQLDWRLVEERDERFGVSSERKKEGRRDIEEPRVHQGELLVALVECLFVWFLKVLSVLLTTCGGLDADYAWKKGGQ
jgi:hypothetical protein